MKLFPEDLKLLLQCRNAEEIQHIDQTMLQQRSVSSLRDLNLFSPPIKNVLLDQ